MSFENLISFYVQKNLETFVQDCYDAIALFLCVHLILRYQLMCHKRAVPALDSYWDTLQTVIWPRYVFSVVQFLVQSHAISCNHSMMISTPAFYTGGPQSV
jgi:hypothetical protein